MMVRDMPALAPAPVRLRPQAISAVADSHAVRRCVAAAVIERGQRHHVHENQTGELDFVNGPVKNGYIQCRKCNNSVHLSRVRTHFMTAKAHQEDRDSNSLNVAQMKEWLCLKDGKLLANQKETIARGGKPRTEFESKFDQAWARLHGAANRPEGEEAHADEEDVEAKAQAMDQVTVMAKEEREIKVKLKKLEKILK